MPDDQSVEHVLLALAHLAQIRDQPFVLCIDQVDNLDHDKLKALARFLHALLDHASNMLVIVSGVKQTLLGFREDDIISEAAWDRIAQYKVDLPRVTQGRRPQDPRGAAGAVPRAVPGTRPRPPPSPGGHALPAGPDVARRPTRRCPRIPPPRHRHLGPRRLGRTSRPGSRASGRSDGSRSGHRRARVEATPEPDPSSSEPGRDHRRDGRPQGRGAGRSAPAATGEPAPRRREPGGPGARPAGAVPGRRVAVYLPRRGADEEEERPDAPLRRAGPRAPRAGRQGDHHGRAVRDQQRQVGHRGTEEAPERRASSATIGCWSPTRSAGR